MPLLTGDLNGWTFGPDGPGHVVAIDGLPWDSPPITSHDEPLPGGGVALGADVVGGQTITATFGLMGTSLEDLTTTILTFKTATPVLPYTLITLAITFPGVGSTSIGVKVRSRVIHLDYSGPWKMAEADVVLFAPDPNW